MPQQENAQPATHSRSRIKNIVVIVLIVLAVVVTGAVGYVLRQQSQDPTTDAAPQQKPIKVYFSQPTIAPAESRLEVNVFLENTPGDPVTGATIILKYPSTMLSFDKSRTANFTTQANSECQQNGFKLEGFLDGSDNGDGTVTLTRYAPFVSQDTTPPSGKFCFGTFSFNVLTAAAGSQEITFVQSDQTKIIGSGIQYNPSYGNAAGANAKTVVTFSANPTPVTTVTPLATPTPTQAATPTPTPIQTVSTPTPTSVSTPTATPTRIVTTTPVGTTTTVEEEPEEPTDEPEEELPDTAYVPVNPAIITALGIAFLLLTVVTLRRRYSN